MIQLVPPEEYGTLAGSGSPFFARILSAARMYGGFPFLEIWRQTGQDGAPQALVSRMDGVINVDVCGMQDGEELREFLRMLGGTFWMDNRWAGLLGEPVCTGVILRREHVPSPVPDTFLPHPMQVHALLCECRGEGVEPPPPEAFYLDLSHRLRHGGAHLAGISEGESLLACAMTVAETPQLAMLGGVAVHPQARGRGLGKEVVRRLLAQLPQPEICLFARRELRGFYAALGFVPDGEWAQVMW